jgi:hypothetical protein
MLCSGMDEHDLITGRCSVFFWSVALRLFKQNGYFRLEAERVSIAEALGSAVNRLALAPVGSVKESQKRARLLTGEKALVRLHSSSSTEKEIALTESRQLRPREPSRYRTLPGGCRCSLRQPSENKLCEPLPPFGGARRSRETSASSAT